MAVITGIRGRLSACLISALPILLALSTTFMAWKGLCVMTASPTPVVCVVSESMAPAFHRGDILLLSNRQHRIQTGDIPVVWFPGYPLPMVHRAIKTWHTDEGQHLLTKGDNNQLDDIALYPPGRTSVARKEVLGLVRGYFPFAGWLVIAFQQGFFARDLAARFSPN